MVALFLLQTLGAIGPQALPPTGCAAFLWTRETTPRLLAMVGPALTLNLDGKPVTLPRTGAEGGEARGLPATSRYATGAIVATLTLTVVERPDLADGALVPEAILTIEQAGHDTMVTPLGGMIGCAPKRN